MTATFAAAMFAAVLSAGTEGPGGAGPGTAPSQNESLVRAQVNSYLGSSEITAQSWKELGPTALPFVTKAATDRDAAPPRRVRAIQALSIIGSRSDAPPLVELARSESEPSAVRVAAMRTTAKLLPRADAVAALKPMLRGSRSPRMRAVAADHLTRLSKRQCTAVRAQVERERPREQKQFQRALRRCPAPPPPPPAEPTAAPPPPEPSAPQPTPEEEAK